MIVLYGPNGLSGLHVLSLVVEEKDKKVENVYCQMGQEVTRNYFVLVKAS